MSTSTPSSPTSPPASSLPDAWVDAVLDAVRVPATEIDVARALWTAHENEIRESGDLVLTWQVELRSALEARLSTGALQRLHDGTLTVGVPADGARADGAPGVDPRTPWSAEQVVVPVEAYVAMLRAEAEGRPVRRAATLAEAVTASGRPPEQVERIWANVSHVLQEFGYEPLPSCAPRSNVPAGVRAAVRAALGLPD